MLDMLVLFLFTFFIIVGLFTLIGFNKTQKVVKYKYIRGFTVDEGKPPGRERRRGDRKALLLPTKVMIVDKNLDQNYKGELRDYSDCGLGVYSEVLLMRGKEFRIYVSSRDYADVIVRHLSKKSGVYIHGCEFVERPGCDFFNAILGYQ
jgi:hypothetical protein